MELFLSRRIIIAQALLRHRLFSTSRRQALPLPTQAATSSSAPPIRVGQDASVMTTTVEMASVPSADTPGTCIFVHHDKRSYLFGRVSEGTQRAFGSRRLHLAGTEQVFLSGEVCWEQVGGLYGYLLSIGGAMESAREGTMAENEKRRKQGQRLLNRTRHAGVGVHGAENLCHVLAACRPTIFRQPISVHVHEHLGDVRSDKMDEADWEDDAIRVWKVPCRRARSSSPRKRMGGGGETTYKPRAGVSDPSVAASIVERIMFNGSVRNPSVLIPVKVGQLRATDVAVVKQGGVLRSYKGPYGEDVKKPDDTAWLFPREGETGTTGQEAATDGGEALHINHFPLPRTAYADTSMSYIVKCHGRRGKFNAPLAKALGVTPKDNKLLAAGQTVQGADGPVTPDMVLGEPLRGRGIIVADIRSRDFLDSFMDRPEWANAELMSDMAVMYWILGEGLAGDARVQSFIREHEGMKHVLCAEETCPNMITHPGGAEIQAKLRRVDPDRFPVLKFENTVRYPAPPPDSSMELGRAGRKLQLMPRLLFNDDAAAPFPDLVEAYNSVDAEVLAMAEAAKAQASDAAFLARVEEEQQDMPNRDAEIIPLGTGSSVPSKYRNVSGTLIRVPGIGSYLLDCGEGTLGQIRRLFSPDEAADVLRSLRCIVISHVHADHHLGTPTVVKAWYQQALADGRSDDTLAISCIGRYRGVLEELSQVEDLGFHRLRFPSPDDNDNDDGDDNNNNTPSSHLSPHGLRSIKRIPVPHCWKSYGTQLELSSGLRIAYSGDCRPSAAFAKACHGAHLLVHECTFDDDKADHAKKKKHSTLGEALWVSAEMGARRTLLTHFSQRYSKADSLRRDAQDDGSVLLAFDFMRVRLGDFRKAACYMPAVNKLMEKLAD